MNSEEAVAVPKPVVERMIPARARASRRRSEHVKVCQAGYRPYEEKLALLTAPSQGNALVRRARDDVAVLDQVIAPAQADADSGDLVHAIDFSELTQPGIYYLEVPGVGTSYDFHVAANVFARPFRLAMRMFTGQRCGCRVDLGPDFSAYQHPACHAGDVASFHPSSGKEGRASCPGGWHDAGDYGRYVVNAAVSTASLLWAWDLNSRKLRGIQLDLPESGGPVPDMLAEVKWTLRWMLAMQDADGGVWHKATSADFVANLMPHDDREPILIVGSGEVPFKTTSATADLAAVCAMAARVYRSVDPSLSVECKARAERAWRWLATTPDHHFARNPQGIETGGYTDTSAADERLWASAELFRATGNHEYNDYFVRHYANWQPALNGDAPHTWNDVRNLAMFACAMTETAAARADVIDEIRGEAISAADAIARRSRRNGYRIALRPQDYDWGSNSIVANYAMMLLIANRIRPRRAYLTAALDALHYLLGRNTFNTSFVTHVGSRWPMHPHHRPSMADGIVQPWPGMLVGGPNAEGRVPPARQWFDDDQSFKTNEVAINWNAPLVFLLAEALPEP